MEILKKHIDQPEGLLIENMNLLRHMVHTFRELLGGRDFRSKSKRLGSRVQMYGWNFNTQSNGLPVYSERDLAATNDGVELTSNSYGAFLTTGYNTTRYNVSDRGDDDVTVKHPFY
jgi:hypothetical protein